MTITKKLRNRIIGVLVILSLVMILLPAMMDPEEIYKKSDNTIAIDSHGVVQNQESVGDANWQVERDYSDLLAPVDDTLPSVSASAAAAPSSAASTEHPDNDLNPFEVQYASAAAASAQSSSAPVATESAAARRAAAAPAPAAAETSMPKVQHTASASMSTSASSSRTVAAKPAHSSTAASSGSSASSAGEKFAVQVGVFSKEANASSVVAKLNSGGMHATTESVTINGKQMIRVYAGRAATREAAKKLAEKALALTGTAARIVALD